MSICTPPWLHASQAIAAMEAGLHVLVEKPMAMSGDECREMCEVARRQGVQLAIVHNFLFSRSVSRILSRVKEGRAGEVRGVLGFQMSTPRRRLPDWYDVLPGQLFFDESPHLVYLARKLLGPDEPVVLHASSIQAPQEMVQRTQSVMAVVRSSRGLGTISMNFNASRAEWGFTAIGSRESYIIDLFRDQFLVLGTGGTHSPVEVLAQTASGLAHMAVGAISSGALYATGRLLYGHDAVVSGFLEAIRRGIEPPVTGEEGHKTVTLMEGICRAAGLVPDVDGKVPE